MVVNIKITSDFEKENHLPTMDPIKITQNGISNYRKEDFKTN